MILLGLLSPLCWVLASLCNAVMDTLADRTHFEQSIFSKYNAEFWLKTDSWDNKYIDIDGDSEGDVEGGLKHKGVFGFLNNLSDGWHIFQSMMIIFLAFSVILFQFTINIFIFDNLFLNISMWAILLGALWNGPFNVTYNKLLKKNKNKLKNA